jgi:hypothetical protein
MLWEWAIKIGWEFPEERQELCRSWFRSAEIPSAWLRTDHLFPQKALNLLASGVVLRVPWNGGFMWRRRNSLRSNYLRCLGRAPGATPVTA